MKKFKKVFGDLQVTYLEAGGEFESLKLKRLGMLWIRLKCQ